MSDEAETNKWVIPENRNRPFETYRFKYVHGSLSLDYKDENECCLSARRGAFRADFCWLVNDMRQIKSKNLTVFKESFDVM